MISWTCIENCGACCKFDLKERSYLAGKLNKEDIALINSMTAKDGWCKKKCAGLATWHKTWIEKIKNA